jgi:hypothetical protein
MKHVKYFRILWLTIFTACLILGLILVALIVVGFFLIKPVIVTNNAQKAPIRKVIFPAVTMCPPKTFKASQLTEAIEYAYKLTTNHNALKISVLATNMSLKHEIIL